MRLFLVFLLIATMVMGFAASGEATGPRESDLIIHIKKKKGVKSKSAKIVKKSKDVENTVEMYTVDVDKDARTGTISVQGGAGEIFSRGSGKDVKVNSKVGGVKVGKP